MNVECLICCSINWKMLFGEQIHNRSKAFLFNNSNLLHTLQLISLTRPSSFQLDWQPLYPWYPHFCIKLSERERERERERDNIPVKIAHKQMNKGKEWQWTFWQVFKARVIKGVFTRQMFSNLTNVLVSVTMIPLNLVIRISLAFLAPKVIELLW